MSNGKCSGCGVSLFNTAHKPDCPIYLKSLTPQIKSFTITEGRQSGKTLAAFDIALENLEQGRTVYIKLPDEN